MSKFNNLAAAVIFGLTTIGPPASAQSKEGSLQSIHSSALGDGAYDMGTETLDIAEIDPYHRELFDSARFLANYTIEEREDLLPVTPAEEKVLNVLSQLPQAFQEDTIVKMFERNQLNIEELLYILNGYFAGGLDLDPLTQQAVLQATRSTIVTDDVSSICMSPNTDACRKDGVSILPEHLWTLVYANYHELFHMLQERRGLSDIQQSGELSDNIRYNYQPRVDLESILFSVNDHDQEIVENISLAKSNEVMAEFFNLIMLESLGIESENWSQYFGLVGDEFEIPMITRHIGNDPELRHELYRAYLRFAVLDIADIIGDVFNTNSAGNFELLNQALGSKTLPHVYRADRDLATGFAILAMLSESSNRAYYNYDLNSTLEISIDWGRIEGGYGGAVTIEDVPRMDVLWILLQYANKYQDPKILRADFSSLITEEFTIDVINLLRAEQFEELSRMGENKVLLAVLLDTFGKDYFFARPDILRRVFEFEESLEDYSTLYGDDWLFHLLSNVLSSNEIFIPPAPSGVLYNYRTRASLPVGEKIKVSYSPGGVIVVDYGIIERGRSVLEISREINYSRGVELLKAYLPHLIINSYAGKNITGMPEDVYEKFYTEGVPNFPLNFKKFQQAFRNVQDPVGFLTSVCQTFYAGNGRDLAGPEIISRGADFLDFLLNN